MQEDGKIILMQDSPRATLKTISFFNAYCVGLQTNFTPGAGGGGSLQMHIRVSPQRVAVGAIIHDNNWPLVSHGAGETFAPQPKPKPKKGLATPYEYPIDILQPKPPAPTKTEPTKTQPPSPRKPPSLPKLPRIPRNVPSVPPLPHPVLVFLAALLGWHDAGVANEWEHKLPEKEEKRWQELDKKRRELQKEGKVLPAHDYEEWLALDQQKFPYGRDASGNRPGREASEPSDEDLMKAGEQPDRGGYTVAGRAAQKHGSRPGSAFPPTRGNEEATNEQGREVLREIINDPSSTRTARHHARYGDVLEVRQPDGRGARFSADGKRFLGFIEPNQL